MLLTERSASPVFWRVSVSGVLWPRTVSPKSRRVAVRLITGAGPFDSSPVPVMVTVSVPESESLLEMVRMPVLPPSASGVKVTVMF